MLTGIEQGLARIRAAYPQLAICTVVGFPLGYSVTAAKLAEIFPELDAKALERRFKPLARGEGEA